MTVPEKKWSPWVEHGFCESPSTEKCARVPVGASQEAVQIVISIMLIHPSLGNGLTEDFQTSSDLPPKGITLRLSGISMP